MDEAITLQNVLLSIPDKNPCNGVIEIQKLSMTARILRSFLNSVGVFFVTCFMIVLPLLHFILVPLGLLLTIAVFILSLQTDKIISGGTGTCPSCGGTINFVRRKIKFPYFETCGACSSESQVTQIA